LSLEIRREIAHFCNRNHQVKIVECLVISHFHRGKKQDTRKEVTFVAIHAMHTAKVL
jgi:hypothetical protein